MPGLFAPSIVPIALGYVVAHYYSLFVLTGQQTVGQLADPLGTGANLLGLGGRPSADRLGRSRRSSRPSRWRAIVVGHVLGVVARARPGRRAVPATAGRGGADPVAGADGRLHVAGLLLLFAA